MDNTQEQTGLYEIKRAFMKDGQCSYTYELLSGPTKGDMITRKGQQIVHEDMNNAFDNLDVFLAHIDGAFKTWADNQTPLEKLEEQEELDLYRVTGFRISGVEENRSVILSGAKNTEHGMITFDTPKIKFEGVYIYNLDLDERLNTAIAEVEAYMNGKMAPISEQTAMDFDNKDWDIEDFESAKVE